MKDNMQPIMEELKPVRKELYEIKQAMPDKEMFLTFEESKLLEESYKNERKKKLSSGEYLRKN